MDLKEFALKIFLSFFFNLEIAGQVLFSFSLKKVQKQFYKKCFHHCYGQYYIIHEQYLPSVSGLPGIIKSTGFPKYRTLNMKLEEAYLLLFIVMMTSNLTASAPKRKLKIKVTLLL